VRKQLEVNESDSLDVVGDWGDFMFPLSCPAITLVLSITAAAGAFKAAGGQIQDHVERAGVISGRVILQGKPAKEAVIVLSRGRSELTRIESASTDTSMMWKTVADEGGRFRFNDVAPGRYEVCPFAAAFVYQEAKIVTVSDGEMVEGIDFELVRGGAITGRVTNGESRPMVLERVTLTQIDASGKRQTRGSGGPLPLMTDDRGIYRAYGLPAGRYTVSVGKTVRTGGMEFLFKRPPKVETFYPAVTDESKAGVLEVAAGTEVANVDISLGPPVQTYKVTGRVVAGDSGKPVPNIVARFASTGRGPSLTPSGRSLPTNSAGEFRFEELAPGQYAGYVSLSTSGEADRNSDPVTFEVTNADVGGVLITARRGGSIEGVAAIEGVNEPDLLARLAQLRIAALVVSEGAIVTGPALSAVDSNGGFHIGGLASGKVRLGVVDSSSKAGFTVLRVERSGIQQRGPIELGVGQRIADVRLVLTYPGGVLRGRVKVEGGELPKTAQLSVSARLRSSETAEVLPSATYKSTRVDAKGLFALEGLAPGEYDVMLSASLAGDADTPLLVRQTVLVTNESVSEVVLILDLANRTGRN